MGNLKENAQFTITGKFKAPPIYFQEIVEDREGISRILDLDFGPIEERVLAIYTKPKKEPEPEGEPMKQNGRSAAYLAHDPTKRHKRFHR